MPFCFFASGFPPSMCMEVVVDWVHGMYRERCEGRDWEL